MDSYAPGEKPPMRAWLRIVVGIAMARRRKNGILILVPVGCVFVVHGLFQIAPEFGGLVRCGGRVVGRAEVVELAIGAHNGDGGRPIDVTDEEDANSAANKGTDDARGKDGGGNVQQELQFEFHGRQKS